MSAEDIGYRAESTANWRRSKAHNSPRIRAICRRPRSWSASLVRSRRSKDRKFTGKSMTRRRALSRRQGRAAARMFGRTSTRLWPPNFARSDFTAIMTGRNFSSGGGTCCGRRSRACPFPNPTSTEEAVNGSSVKRSSSSEVPRKPIPMPTRGPAELELIKGSRTRAPLIRSSPLMVIRLRG